MFKPIFNFFLKMPILIDYFIYLDLVHLYFYKIIKSLFYKNIALRLKLLLPSYYLFIYLFILLYISTRFFYNHIHIFSFYHLVVLPQNSGYLSQEIISIPR